MIGPGRESAARLACLFVAVCAFGIPCGTALDAQASAAGASVPQGAAPGAASLGAATPALNPALAAAAKAANAAGAEKAVLVRGTIALRGLPFFAPNAIPALGGEYLLGTVKGGIRVPVWYTRESISFDKAWKRDSLAEYTAYILARPEGPVLAIAAGRYTLFLEPETDSPAARAFAAAFARRFAFFFEGAANDAELSFPSFVNLGS